MVRKYAVRVLVAAASGLLALTIACAGDAAKPTRAAESKKVPLEPIGSVKYIMRILDPSADAVWNSVGTIVSAAGTEERAPKTDEEWDALLTHAFAVAETANLLLLPGRAVDEDGWVERAVALRESGVEAVEAVEKHDAAALMAAGEHITEACDQCHQKYWTAWHDTDISGLPAR